MADLVLLIGTVKGAFVLRSSEVRADFSVEGPYFKGEEIYKIARDPVLPDTFYLQHHWGIYRSDDGGETWTDVGKGDGGQGVPSDFGFPMVAHPRRSGTAYVIPLEGDFFRCVPGGVMQVWRTTNGGSSWEGLGRGLPDHDAYLTVLRDAFDADALDPHGLWFGTRTGEVFGSADEGESWRLVAEHLPPVLCVKAAVVA